MALQLLERYLSDVARLTSRAVPDEPEQGQTVR